MGLDMYLLKYQKIKGIPFKAQTEIDVSELEEDFKKAFEPYIKEKGTAFKWEALYEDVMYWRKANAIHKFFVDTVQNDEDDCGYYEVNLETIKKLNNLCEQALKITTESPKKIIQVQIGWSKDGPIYEDVEVYDVDKNEIDNLLPTQSGFFFGNTEYDACYIRDLKDTIEACNKIINEFDFENNYLAYTSSW